MKISTFFSMIALAALFGASPATLADQPDNGDSSQADTTSAETDSNGSAFWPEIDLDGVIDALMGDDE